MSNIKQYTWNFTWKEPDVKKIGYIGIGTNNPQKHLDVNGDIKINTNLYKNNNLVVNWQTNNSNNIYYSNKVGINKVPNNEFDIQGQLRAVTRLINSDYRLKTNICNENLGLMYINSLEPKIFTYIDYPELGNIHGFIAQDIINNTSNSDIVIKNSNEFYKINLTSLIGPIVKSLQELIIENNEISENIANIE